MEQRGKWAEILYCKYNDEWETFWIDKDVLILCKRAIGVHVGDIELISIDNLVVFAVLFKGRLDETVVVDGGLWGER